MAAALGLQHSYLYAEEEPMRDRRVRYEAKNPRTLQRASVKLKIDKGAFDDDEDEQNSDWETVKAILNFLGYEPKFVHATLVSRFVVAERHQVMQFSASQIDRYHRDRKRVVNAKHTRVTRFKAPRILPKVEGRMQILRLVL
ncbi:MAG: hypothetical protein A2162_13105 [Deltaproteobacteria bacterium RBG_13_52_11b]|nr:MAG: hypothetical protein A2162_13105 [Deltaproteobacteria bacterium RBG_13_52_11b]